MCIMQCTPDHALHYDPLSLFLHNMLILALSGMLSVRAVQRVFPDSGMPGFPPSTGFPAQMRSHALATWYLCMLTALLGLHSPVCPG